jgi:hypothetical protein
MRKGSYKKALEAARDELQQLYSQQEEVSKRIVKLRKTIAHLAELCDEHDIGIDAENPFALDILFGTMGLTEACREVVKAADPDGLTPVEVKEGLRKMGFDMSDYKNILSSIHTVLKRLAKSGVIDEGHPADDKEGKRVYRWSPFQPAPKKRGIPRTPAKVIPKVVAVPLPPKKAKGKG